MAGILFIISAPSGSGKSTLVGELRNYVEGLEFSVSYTTRSPRGSEEDGREYHFTTRENFERMIREDAFLEWADVFGNYYGTARAALAQAAKNEHDLLLDIDVQGALQVMERVPEAVSIFILPPSPAILETRLRNRSAAERMTDEAVIERRLRQAHGELEHVSKYRFAIVNNVLDTAAAELRAIVLQARGVASQSDVALANGCRTEISPEGVRQVLEQFAAAPLTPATK